VSSRKRNYIGLSLFIGILLAAIIGGTIDNYFLGAALGMSLSLLAGILLNKYANG